MALFGSKSGDHVDDSEYSPVLEEEHKPLRMDSDGEEGEPSVPHHEIYALSRSLRRTNLFLKVIIGLLAVTIIVLLSMNIPDKVKDIIKNVSCETKPNLIKSPVPPSKLISFKVKELKANACSQYQSPKFSSKSTLSTHNAPTICPTQHGTRCYPKGEASCIYTIGRSMSYRQDRIPRGA